MSALWRRAISEHDWWSRLDIAHDADLTRGCRDGDVARVKQLIYDHTHQVEGLVRELINQAGEAL